MIIYLTYNDQPSGVYWSQVTDVVEHLNTLGHGTVRLVALVSGRDFRKTRRAIKAHSPRALVLPMVPTMKRWRMNRWLLSWVCRFLRPTGMICRGPFATWMALRMRDRGLTKKVCFDGRGAYAAEWEEYRIIDDDALIAQLRPLEKEAVQSSDFRIAVSKALVEHWQERYAYTGEAHVVVPCTLGLEFEKPVAGMIDRFRNDVGYSEEDIVLVYSGSTAGWQSFELLERFLVPLMSEQSNVRVTFLSKPDPKIASLQERFPGRVEAHWADPAMVKQLLVIYDHGILLREETITNRVSSPTKFAEYLSVGVPVLISPGIGDFSALTREHDLGMVLDGHPPRLARPSNSDRNRIERFAMEHFRKRAYGAAYGALMKALSA
ncbi:MAG: hypothetical protein ABI599_04385 [Flavobacteriales bacterium]